MVTWGYIYIYILLYILYSRLSFLFSDQTDFMELWPDNLQSVLSARSTKEDSRCLLLFNSFLLLLRSPAGCQLSRSCRLTVLIIIYWSGIWNVQLIRLASTLSFSILHRLLVALVKGIRHCLRTHLSPFFRSLINIFKLQRCCRLLYVIQLNW